MFRCMRTVADLCRNCQANLALNLILSAGLGLVMSVEASSECLGERGFKDNLRSLLDLVICGVVDLRHNLVSLSDSLYGKLLKIGWME